MEILPIIVWRLLRYIQQGRILKKRKHERERERENHEKKYNANYFINNIYYVWDKSDTLAESPSPSVATQNKSKVKIKTNH